MVRTRGGRKRALGTRAPMAIPQGLKQHWSLDLDGGNACLGFQAQVHPALRPAFSTRSPKS